MGIVKGLVHILKGANQPVPDFLQSACDNAMEVDPQEESTSDQPKASAAASAADEDDW